MRTPQQILEECRDIMPFDLKECFDPYMIECMEIYAKEYHKSKVESGLLHSVSGSFLCGHDQHGYRKCHEQCTECKEQQKYCEDCGDWVGDGCDNEDCKNFKGNER